MAQPFVLDVRFIYQMPNGETHEGVWFPEEIFDMDKFLMEALAPHDTSFAFFERIVKVEFKKPER